MLRRGNRGIYQRQLCIQGVGAILDATYDDSKRYPVNRADGLRQTVSWSADVARGMEKIPVLLHAEARAILQLAPIERFVFVMSVLERYSDNDCSILLGCARREVAAVRTLAMQQLATFLSAKYQTQSSADNSIIPENIATITTPLIAQYFALPGVELGA